jgi:hypothetical protein
VFRREVEEPERLPGKASQHPAPLGGGQRAVERGGGNAAGTGRRDLILHERDEGRHHDGEAVQRERGHLEADRLPGAGGEDGEHVLPGKHGGHDLVLPRPKGAVAEVPLE